MGFWNKREEEGEKGEKRGVKLAATKERNREESS